MKKNDRSGRFLQPLDAIEIVERSDGPQTLISPDVYKAVFARIAAGEDREKVLSELAGEIVDLEDGLREAGLMPAAGESS